MLTGHTIADPDGMLLAIDPHVCEILQREERELVGISFETITHPDDLKGNVAAIAQLSTEDGPLAIRKRYLLPNGLVVWSNVQVSRLKGRDASRLVGTIQLIDPGNINTGPANLWRAAMRVSEQMLRRRFELGEELFSDYGWIILLQVYLAEAEGRITTADLIGDAVAVRSSLVARWLKVLEQKKLIERRERHDLPPQLTVFGIRTVETLLGSDVYS